MSIIKDVISPQEELDLITLIDNQEWNPSLSRRTQHYGYEYIYKTRSLIKSNPIIEGLVPKCVSSIINPEQIIVNEYKKGQGISPHMDATVFGNTICIISLLDDVTFNLGDESFILPRRSMLILKDDDRYNKKHHLRYSGNRRVSITYRTLS